MSEGNALPLSLTDQVASLIESLRENLSRLEELQGVKAAQGATLTREESLLISRANEQMFYSQTANKAAILNALPGNVALLDNQGRIIQVNQAWRQFSLGNLLQGPGYGIGVNYLWICDSAQGEESGKAHEVAVGIRAVLNDGAKHFSIEYPCHSATEKRWFQLTVTPMIYGRQNGAVIMHWNITERVLANQRLLESERRFSDMLKDIQLASVMLDLDAKITYCNDYLLTLTGWKHEEVMGKDWFEVFMPREQGDMKPVFEELIAEKSEARYREHPLVTRSGESRLVRWNNSVLRSVTGEVVGTASIGEDITERTRAHERVVQLNRVHRMLSGINALIVHANTQDELFKEACRIAVEAGGFKMAVICLLEPGNTGFRICASAGDESGLFESIRKSMANNRIGADSIATKSVTEKKILVSNDVQNDVSVMLAEEYVEAGIKSLAVLPLVVADAVVGVLVLFAPTCGFFHDDEIKLLTELATDIAFAIDHIEKQDRLEYLAYYDDITGLANRRLFLERVAQFTHTAEQGDHRLAVALIDLERFKNINDSLGHAAGDALLKQVAQWLSDNLGGADLVARVGTDHFAMVIPVVMKSGNVGRLLDVQMAALTDHPFQLNGGEFRIAFKGGIAMYPDDGSTALELFKNAEAALKKAKAKGDRYLFYTRAMTDKVAVRLTMENQLRQALEKNEYVLHYQPKINLETGKLTSAEALIRWNDPRTGLVAPGQFISILEETGLIYEVGRWAMRSAIETYLRWQKKGLPAVRIAVNVSPLQLRHRDFIARIKSAISHDAYAAAGLELEITESLIMEDVKHSIASLSAIREMGVTVAIDDFGTGFSSLSYLSKLPVDSLKIDRSFITEMTGSPEGVSLVSTIVNLGQSLKLKVVAEGVETKEQMRLLQMLKCDEMQGFLYSKPVPGNEFETLFLGGS